MPALGIHKAPPQFARARGDDLMCGGAREVLSAWVPHHPTAAPQDLAQVAREGWGFFVGLSLVWVWVLFLAFL